MVSAPGSRGLSDIGLSDTGLSDTGLSDIDGTAGRLPSVTGTEPVAVVPTPWTDPAEGVPNEPVSKLASVRIAPGSTAGSYQLNQNA